MSLQPLPSVVTTVGTSSLIVTVVAGGGVRPLLLTLQLASLTSLFPGFDASIIALGSSSWSVRITAGSRNGTIALPIVVRDAVGAVASMLLNITVNGKLRLSSQN